MQVNQIVVDGIMKRRAITALLLIGFILLTLIVAGVDYVSLSTMKQLHGKAQSIAEQEWIDVLLATNALEHSNQNIRIVTRLVLATDSEEIRSLLAERAANSRIVDVDTNTLGGRIGSPGERALYDAVVEARTAYLESCQRALSKLVNDHDANSARAIFIGETLPLQAKYHVAWGDFIHFQTQEMNQQLAASSSQYLAARNRSIFLVVVSLLVVLGVGSIVIWRVMLEIQRRQNAEQKICKLNEELELKVSQRTAALASANDDLTAKIAERTLIENQLLAKAAFFEAQINSTLDGILVVGEDNRVVLRNDRFLELFEIPPSIVTAEDDQLLLKHAVSMAKDGHGFLTRVHYLYSHPSEVSRDEIEFKNGFVVDRYSSPVLGKDGKYYGRIWVFRDITQRKKNEETVRRLSVAVEQSPVSVVITNLSGEIVYVNRKFVESTGYSYEEVIGKNPRILKTGHTTNEEYGALWKAIKAGKEWRGEFQNRKKNGEIYWEYAVIRPIEDENGIATHFLAVKEDITERRQMEIQLRHAQRLESIGQLAAGIAHEINTPIQYVGDNTTFLADAFGGLRSLLSKYERLLTAAQECGAPDEVLNDVASVAESIDISYLLEEIPKALAQAKEGLGRVSKLVGAMKEFSHPGTKEKTLCDLNRAIESTITVSRNEWKYVSNVEKDLDPKLPLVLCLPNEFNQVILNLIINAAHSIADVVGKTGTGKGTIRIATRDFQDWVEISIQDTGTGIPAHAQARMFEPFFTTKEVGKGTGQGLAIARSVVVDKHQGSIHFETEEGKGTTFIIRLPKEGKKVPALAAQGAFA